MNVNLLQELLQAIIAEFKQHGICKIEITLSGAQSDAADVKDYALLAICNNDKGIYACIQKKLSRCKKPKDLKNIIEFLKDNKCIQSKEMFNQDLIYSLLSRAPKYDGKRVESLLNFYLTFT